MLGHLLKLIWQRKSRNLMLSLEILLAFVVVFAICAFAVRYTQLYQLPVGFRHADVWSVGIGRSMLHDTKNDPQLYDNFKRGLEALPEVQKVAFVSFSPFSSSRRTTDFKPRPDSRPIESGMIEVSDDYFAATGMVLASGRWFSAADEGTKGTPVVLNRAMAHTMFPGQDPLGKQFDISDYDSKTRDIMTVTGVVEEYRNQGQLSTPGNMMVMRYSPLSSKRSLQTIVLKLRPGTTRAFEARLQAALKQIKGDVAYTVKPLSDLRAERLRVDLIPLVVLGIVAAFLVAMVGFGLFGVLWQNTTRRIPEFGLRRALGAGSADIYRQIVVEQVLLSSLAMGLGLLLLVQLPLTGALGDGLNWQVFGVAAALSMGLIYLLSLVCALYPGWQASRLSPTAALHYE